MRTLLQLLQRSNQTDRLRTFVCAVRTNLTFPSPCIIHNKSVFMIILACSSNTNYDCPVATQTFFVSE